MSDTSMIPKYSELMNPVLKALHELGGSGSNAEIDLKAAELLNLSEEITNIPHNPEKSSMTEFEYRLAWARTYLKKYGVIDNSGRGVWAIVPEKRNVTEVDPQELIKKVRAEDKIKKDNEKIIQPTPGEIDVELSEDDQPWREKLHHLLIHDLSPDAFERLTKRILRESGFIQVEVTGKSGDGGIDGKGILRVSGLLSFHVIFQCKKYKGSVTSSDIRDFRGAMIGRADKGLFITTGTFTRDAIREATRDGAPPIDLMDGDQLADKLKELGLGIKKEMIEKVTIDPSWFLNI